MLTFSHNAQNIGKFQAMYDARNKGKRNVCFFQVV